MRKTSLVLCAVVATALATTAGALAYANAAGNAPATEAAPPGIAPAVFSAMQRDLHLTPTQARTRLANEDRAARTQQVLRKTLGGTYGGTWLSPDAGTVTVAITDNAQERFVRALGAVPFVVARSEAQLDAAVATLDRHSAAAPRTVKGWYADLATNSVVVLSSTGDAGGFLAASGVDRAAVRVEKTSEDPRPYIDVIGGNAYYIGSGTRCSVGFSVNGGFVTAGHCGTTGARTTQPGGTFRGSSFPGNDYAWVQVDAGNTPRGLVNNYSGGSVAVAGSTEAAVGASVCRSGSTTGWRCGTIQQKNASVTYSQGTVTGLVRSNACAEPGDSGGSWMSGSQAQGVTSGGSGNCTSGGTMYYQPVNEILQAYGLTLVTSGGGTPTPTATSTSSPPQGGTWAPYTNYATGATVTYGGTTYRCLQGHTSQVGWEPPNVPALWSAV
ncbi:alpha-lytic protease prodomain-containing protein [Dactylosporangium sp. AC04546]|uniref:carbohydrate-binding protein n=1 Tax=Dactylosporangium sp. AC04546 TaxID=2862460 RepID=UPI001EDEA127|nr:carbohydrate-binding protein [Dactylosporangium sp. AC04546]WVK83518.1 alpha-lytic protease prodomain-containing protein [Dactylosporangium sp. AC04546]